MKTKKEGKIEKKIYIKVKLDENVIEKNVNLFFKFKKKN